MASMSLGSLEVDIGADTSGLKKADAEVKKTGKSMEKTFGGVGDAIKAALTVEAARRVIMIADNMVRLEGTIKRLTRTTGDFNKVWSDLADISNENGIAMQDSVALFQRFQSSLKKVTESNEDVNSFIDTLQKLGRIGGSSAEELSNALVQLSQGFSGGIIRAEEYNSVIEQAPEILKSAASNIKGMDGDLGKLRQAMLDGKLTAETLFKALQRGAEDTNKEFDEMPRTIDMASKALSNNFALSVAQLDKQLGASQNIAKFIDALATGFGVGQGTDLLGIKQQASLLKNYDKQIEETTAKIERLKVQEKDTGQVIRRGADDYISASTGAKIEAGSVTLLTKELERLTKARDELAAKQPKEKSKTPDEKVALGLGTPVDEKAEKKKSDKEKKLREQQEEDAQETLDTIFLMNKTEKEKLLALETDLLSDIDDLYLENLTDFETAEQAKIEVGRNFAAERLALEKDVVEETVQAYDQLSKTIGDQLGGALAQTQSWSDATKAILADLASQFIQAGITSAFGGAVSGNNVFGDMFSSAPAGAGRAMGGNTSGSLVHPINERGDPEVLNMSGKQYLLPTGKGGTITPMSQAGNGGGTPNISMVNMGTPMNVEGVQITPEGIQIMINDSMQKLDKAITAEMGKPNSRKSQGLKKSFNLTTNVGR